MMTKGEFGKLILLALVLLGLCYTVFGNTPPVRPPARKSERVLALERKFQIQFVSHDKTTLEDGTLFEVWSWTTETPTSTGIIGFCTPVNATDEQTWICILSAIHCAGFVDRWYTQKMSEPSPTPSPRVIPQGAITHT